jgi:peptidoglycan-N-acetylglucosamine deacetylase
MGWLGVDELIEGYAGFEIANHSLTHPWPPDLAGADLAREVWDGRRALQDWFDQPARGFCYPFGGVNSMVKAAVRAAGYCHARTVNEHSPVFPLTDPFDLGVSCRFADPAFWNHYQCAKAAHGVFFFWGHSYELISEAMWIDPEEKIAGISFGVEHR